PEIVTRRFDFSTFSVEELPFAEAQEKAETRRRELADWMEAARHYRQAMAVGSERLERNLELEALAAVLDGGLPVVVLAHGEREIREAIEFAEAQGLEMILAGGREAWKVKGLLAEKGIPVILGQTQSLPSEEDEAYDAPFRNPGELVAAGVKIAFASGAGGGFGPGGPHGSRTTPYEAATAVPYGLPPEAALKAVTLWPAEILGVADRLGSIEPGKLGNLIVTDGDPLAITTAIEYLVIDGRIASSDNRHRRLYETYRAR
ncbi:MAG: amidohydrolase family protein, partial [Thermoanaerobaculia bacterium]|nr:amidohydrolase family protein [Thermoanaerobaculia bacterium]